MTQLRSKTPTKKENSTSDPDMSRFKERDMFLVKLIDNMDILDDLIEELWHDDDPDMIDTINNLRTLASDMRDGILQEAETDLQHRKSK